MNGSGCSISGFILLFCHVVSLRPGHFALPFKPQFFSVASFLDQSTPNLPTGTWVIENDYYFKLLSVRDGLLHSKPNQYNNFIRELLWELNEIVLVKPLAHFLVYNKAQ